MKFLIAVGMTPDEAATLAVLHGCAGYYLSIPPVWQAEADAEAWTSPCVVTMTDDGLVAAWEPV